MNSEFDPSDLTQYPVLAEWLALAAQNDLEAMFNIGLEFYKGKHVPQDFTRSAHWWLKAAEAGHEWSQYNIGCLYIHGRGVAQNHTLGVQWLEKAEAQKNLDAVRAMKDVRGSGQGAFKVSLYDVKGRRRHRYLILAFAAFLVIMMAIAIIAVPNKFL